MLNYEKEENIEDERWKIRLSKLKQHEAAEHTIKHLIFHQTIQNYNIQNTTANN